MLRIAELLPQVPSGSGTASGLAPARYEMPAVHLLGADLPPGHLHVWSGPADAGKTAFLLGLLHAAACHGRTAVLATYDLSAPTLALRLLAMASGVPVASLLPLAEGRAPIGLRAAALADVARARADLASLPFHILEARGMGVASLEDRLVRLPARADVLGIDHVRGVVRPPPVAGAPPASPLHALSDLAVRLHVAVVAVDRVPADAGVPRAADASPDADRVGWIAVAGEGGAWDASLLANRHGRRVSCRLRLDPESGRLLPGPPATEPFKP